MFTCRTLQAYMLCIRHTVNNNALKKIPKVSNKRFLLISTSMVSCILLDINISE